MKSQENHQPVLLSDYTPPVYFVNTLDLYIELEEKDTLVRSSATYVKNPDSDGHALVLNGEEQVLKYVRLDDKLLDESDYELTDTTLTIKRLPEEFKLEVVSLIQPQDNKALTGLYRSNDLFCTQCEAHGFRRITYYQDRPDVMASFTTTIVGDKTKYPLMLSNGNPTQQGDMEGNKHFVTWEDPFKKPCYLFALVAGDLALVKDTYTTSSGRSVDLELYIEHGDEDKCAHAMESLKKSMAFDERVYGLEYDLDIYMIVAVHDFNMGAMENKGLNVFNAKYVLANQSTATDWDFHQVEAVIGHEYFHNWTGNRVTCRDWFQLSLKEGLTVFREQQFSADCGSPVLNRIHNVNAIRARQFAEDAGPMSHPVRPESYIEINNFYTMTVYYKGSEVIRMMHTLLSESGFRKGMDLYFKRHDGQAVTCDDFVAAMSDANEVDLSQFKRWYHQAGTPTVKASGMYDPSAKTYQLTLKQHCAPTADGSPKEPFYMPVKVSLIDEHGQAFGIQSEDAFRINGDSCILVLRETEQTYTFTGIETKPIPSLFGDFSAPVKCHYNYSQDQLMRLMQFDPDMFNRWDASQRLYSDMVLTRMSNNFSEVEKIIPTLTQLLQNVDDPELVAKMLTLPSIDALKEQLPKVPILNLINAWHFIHHQICEALYQPLFNTYQHAQEKDDGTLDAQSVAWRSLKNTCLVMLGHSQAQEALALAKEQYHRSTNMTDTIAALSAMNHFDQDDRDELFEHFYQQWKKDPLVVNKWLSLSAQQHVEHALDKVKSLMNHEAFDLENPNKVYALIGGFSSGNPKFHQSQGQGYEFLAQTVIELDKNNPQVASRMVDPLSHFASYAEPNGGLMKKALNHIAQIKTLSNDVFEIVTKSLDPHA